MRKLKYSMQDQQKPFSEFQQVAAVLEALFTFNMIYVHWIRFQTRGRLFFLSCSRHQNHPEEFEALWIQVTGSAF